MIVESGAVPKSHRPAPQGHAAKSRRSTRARVCVCACVKERGQVGRMTCSLPNRGFNFATPVLCVSIRLSVSLSHTPPLLPLQSNSRLMLMEKEYGQKLTKSTQVIIFFTPTLLYPISFPSFFLVNKLKFWGKFSIPHTHPCSYNLASTVIYIIHSPASKHSNPNLT